MSTQMTHPTMPLIEPEIARKRVPMNDSMLKINARVLDQPLPVNSPQPVSTQIKPKNRTTPPMM